MSAVVWIALALCAARIVLALMINAYVHHWDTMAYVNAAHRPLTQLLLHSDRCATYPLALKLLGYRESAMVVVQSVFASASWLFFAFTLASVFRDRRVRIGAAVAFYLLSFSTVIGQWDYVLYAESLSLSLFALLASFLIRYLSSGDPAELGWLVALVVPFVLTRDSNLFAYGVMAMFAILATPHIGNAWRTRRERALVLAVVALLPVASVLLSRRDIAPLETIILNDIATRPALADEIGSRYDMPRSVAECAGRSRWDCDARRLGEIDSWVMSAGRGWYFRFLLGHPEFAREMLFRSWLPALTGEEATKYGDFAQVRDEHMSQPKVDVIALTSVQSSYYEQSRSVARLFYRTSFSGILAMLETRHAVVLSFLPFAVLVGALIRSRTRGNAAVLLPAVFLALIVISQLPALILSSIEIGRHALLASVSMSYLTLYLAFFCLSAAFGRGSETA